MVNPLARVVMNNVVKEINSSEKTNYTDNVYLGKKVNNLTPKEENLIQNLIKGEEIVAKNENPTIEMISLDEVANRVKDRR